MKVKATARKSTSNAVHGKNLSILLQKTVWDISDSETDSESIETNFAALIQPKFEKFESESECDRDADTVCNDSTAISSGYASESQRLSAGSSSESSETPMSTEGSESEISSSDNDSDTDGTDSETDAIGDAEIGNSEAEMSENSDDSTREFSNIDQADIFPPTLDASQLLLLQRNKKLAQMADYFEFYFTLK